eukprot:CAMPEP_0172380140 /NCGR_PEP_ID=MMETSP1060-20121228/70283_1 /TAXON_ID=37318 /ORGANISM="Pseudo-nitzschia pungens, Strain cf. cingulata" /LENGTH=397 /DNA_ID=CAMNT_0013107889 /DNA_START=558 /DNA_END=1752 /DNA_ORIENTATION=+
MSFFGGGYGGYGVGGFGGGYNANRRFEEQYHCYSVAYADKPDLEKGDKILLPPSAFDTLARLQVDYPMLFKLSSSVDNKITHSGVLEFTAEEGTCYIPFWMMQNLLIEEGAVITVTNVSLPKATFVKLQPQSVDFLEISNPRAVLEHALRNFSCVTKGDIIQLPYNNKNYHFELKEVEPQDAACIIETDCNVDFDAPVGYKEPDYSGKASAATNGGSASPTTMSTTSSATNLDATTGANADEDESKPKGTRIVNGKILRPEDDEEAADGPSTGMLAERTGRTGVQRNAAIPQVAPKVDYWAVNAGDGARLDGKSPSSLKDKNGNEVDIRKLRAEAAARRAEALAASASVGAQKMMASSGKNLLGEEVAPDAQAVQNASSTAAPASKRKTKVGRNTRA